MQVKVKGIIHHQSLLVATAAKKANGQDYDQKNYSVNILFPKNDPQCSIIQAAIDSAILSRFPNGQLPPGARNAWSECTGNLSGFMELRCASKVDFARPHIVDSDTQPIVLPENIKVGDYAWVVGEIAGYTTGNGGTSCYLNGTKITGEVGNIPMEALSSVPTPDIIFAGLGDMPPVAAPPVAAPPVAAPPVAAPPVAAPPVAAPPVAAPPVADNIHQMTASAGGATYDAMIAAGWTDVTLIEAGHMLPPGGVTPSFM